MDGYGACSISPFDRPISSYDERSKDDVNVSSTVEKKLKSHI